MTDDCWTRDELGYNFRHALDVSTDHAFATAGRDYLVEYRLDALRGPGHPCPIPPPRHLR